MYPKGNFRVHIFVSSANNSFEEVKTVKKEEKREDPKPSAWELADPPVPVVQSGHLEKRRQY